MQIAIGDFLRAQTANLPGKVSIETGKLPEDERHAGCQRWQAFLPPGARAWGRVSVGLRCLAGTRSALYVAARVRVEGSYLVAARPIGNGQTIESGDVKVVQGELTAQAPDLLLNEKEVIGQIARSAIAAERPLQATLLRPQPIIQAGQRVQVISFGQGFTVSNEGQALAAAVAGQSVRIKLANGNVVSAIARDNGVVEVRN
ncbi:flagellar basal body P-ring formation chaperone FlgA [Uliginosibacterium sp. 31-16]|uniref:flagellar basal body P-ring formation chaperone FlgA n=1 Tax=Uliginosibacterium sp. 31-16 TaxID=3068315 RepID=UPI00273D119D|nr:flagellar basal body P-ring formation chaperone FlgA [Uliginosibacterium sp. 31-16]MDP5240618.1 flagellar basal body P-ring formation chaperone FlgA [Uliginosibacterium sp. 31-16]